MLLRTLQAAFALMLGSATTVRTQVDFLPARPTTVEFIFEFEPTMYHVKCMVIDDLGTSVGSVDFDNRSFRLNDEANLNVIDREVAATETRSLDEDEARAREVTCKEWQRRPAWQWSALPPPRSFARNAQ